MPLSPNSLLEQSNLTGNLASISGDDASWLSAIDDNTDSIVRVGFPTPVNSPTTGAGIQSFNVKYRVTPNASLTTFTANLFENGTLLAQIDTWTSASTTEVTRNIVWDASALGVADGSGTEVQIVATKTGGSPTARTTGEFQFIEWVNEPDDLDISISATSDSLSLTSQATSVNIVREISSTLQNLSLLERDATVEEGLIEITATLQSLTLSAINTDVKDNNNIDAGSVPLLLTENDADIDEFKQIVSSISNISLTELDTQVSIVDNIEASTYSISLTENNVSTNISALVGASSASLTLTPISAKSAGYITRITATLNSISVLENDVTLKLDNDVLAIGDQLTIGEFSADINQKLDIPVTSDSLVLAESSVGVFQSTEIFTNPIVQNLEVRGKPTTVSFTRLNYIATDVQQLNAGSIVTFYELDLTPFGDSIYRFHPGTNELSTNVIWGGQEYLAFPIEADGFDVSSSGQLPRPRILISNILGTVGSLVRNYDDLVGAKVTRRRTFVKYLDSINFKNGNSLADPNVEFIKDVYYIDRKATETASFIEFELAAVWDVQGIKLPRRQIIQNMCAWTYRSPECGYAGPPVADRFDVATIDPDKDYCSKSLSGCTIRFGSNANLPFGGFPGAGLINV